MPFAETPLAHDPRVDPRALTLARHMAAEAVPRGARAVLLVGSHARGEAHADSDVDLWFIGPGDEYKLLRRDDFLVSETWRSVESIREAMTDPAQVGGLVPALRRAVIVSDPKGAARQLKREAREWTWDTVAARCDAWAAEQITGYAEEVHRLAGCLRLGRQTMAAVVRDVLAARLAVVISVHLRLLYDTENDLWNRVSAALGEPWARAQAASLGLGDESFAESCAAALELYAHAARQVKHLLDPRQLEVVSHACQAAGTPLI